MCWCENSISFSEWITLNIELIVYLGFSCFNCTSYPRTENVDDALHNGMIINQQKDPQVIALFKEAPELVKKHTIINLDNLIYMDDLIHTHEIDCLKYASKRMQNDAVIVVSSVHLNPESIQFASKKLRSNKSIATVGVIHDGLSLRFYDSSLKRDEMICLDAIESNWMAYHFIDDSLKNSATFIHTMIDTTECMESSNGAIFSRFTSEIQHDSDLCLLALSKCNNTIRYIPKDMMNLLFLPILRQAGASKITVRMMSLLDEQNLGYILNLNLGYISCYFGYEFNSFVSKKVLDSLKLFHINNMVILENNFYLKGTVGQLNASPYEEFRRMIYKVIDDNVPDFDLEMLEHMHSPEHDRKVTNINEEENIFLKLRTYFLYHNSSNFDVRIQSLGLMEAPYQDCIIKIH